MKIMYLHGFNSNENSATISEIRKEIPDLISISYDYIEAENAFKQINALIKKTLQDDPDLIIAGTSLGGFWANYFAQKYELICVLINPAIHPSVSLKKAVPQSPLPNFITGELKEFTFENADNYTKFEVPVRTGINRTIVLGRNDEVINYRLTEELYRNKGKIIFTDEGHRIEDYGRIVRILKELSLEN